MDAEPSSQVLLEQLRAGDARAAAAIFQRFARRLVGLARVRLDERLRQKVDAEDVVQSVFRSFFGRSARGEFEFANWEGVWGLLVLLTVRKCGRRALHFQAERRDVRREVPGGGDDSTAEARFIEAIADEPTPEEAALLAETTEEIMRRLRGDKDRQIFELSLQGYSIPEISANVGHYERGVERVRATIKKLLEEMLDAT
jgi:RNA polymerase sigma-70 factor (ECF subfamily)